MREGQQDKANVIALPPFIYLGGLFLSLVLHLRKPLKLNLSFFRKRIAAFSIISGVILFSQAHRTMLAAGTNVNPQQPTTTIVTDGPFRFTRNPIYIAFSAIYIGLTMLLNTFWGLITLPLVLWIIKRGVIEREETYLEQKFGDTYRQYKNRVPRWF